MIGWLLLTAFVADSAPVSDVAAVTPPAQTLKIDVLVKQPLEKCEAQNTDEIIVCADKTDNESQRLHPISNAHIYDKDESAAEFGLSENVRMAVQAESEELQQGIIAKRAMIKLKIKF